MTPSMHITLDPEGLTPAFRKWADLRRARGRSDGGVPRKMMQFWISFAIKKIRQADSGKIEADLMKHLPVKARAGNARQRRQTKRQGALAAKYRGTIAAYLVRILNWQNANTAKKKNGGSAFYGKVGQFKGTRKWSRGVHKAGFFPVMQKLRVPRAGYLPRLKNMPGRYSETFAEGAATLIAENMASSAKRPLKNSKQPAGVSGIAPMALEQARVEMGALIQKWLKEDELAAATKAGFQRA